MNSTKGIFRQMFLKKLVAAAALAGVSQLAAAQGSANWQADWQKLTAAAKQEGELSLAVSFGVGGVPRTTIEEFQKFSGVKVNMQTFQSGSIMGPKILQEQQGGVFNYDVLMVSGPFGPALRDGNALVPLRPQLMRPDVLDTKVWVNGIDASFRDKEKQFGFAPVWELVSHFWINTNFVKPGEIKNTPDLLNPRFKGKMMFSDVRTGATFAAAMGIQKAHGDDMLKRLFVDMEPAYSRDTRQILEQLIKGQRMVVIGVMEPLLPDFKAQGLTNHIQRIVLEDAKVSTTGNDLWMPKRAPHPNAAKLFVNWFLTKDGQTIYTQDTLNNSRRLDVPPQAPERAARAGEKYPVMLGTEDVDLGIPRIVEQLSKLVGAAPTPAR